jgi:hypothetical protein
MRQYLKQQMWQMADKGAVQALQFVVIFMTA